MTNFFEKNIEALLQTNPTLAAQLFAMQGNEYFEVFMDENDAANVNIIDTRDHTPLHKTRPIDETLQIFKTYEPLQRYPFLYFYGIGNGILFTLLLENDQLKRLVVIEPELEMLYIALHLNDFSHAITTRRLALFNDKQLDFVTIANIMNFEDAKIYAKLYFLEVLTPFYDKYQESFLLINQLFAKAIEHIVTSLGNDSTDALVGLEHHIMNLEKMVETPTAIELVTKAKNSDMAIIVSTGPSLTKQLPLLKQIQHSVTIFCIDASFPILVKQGIKPDIVVSMERVYETSEFFSSVDPHDQEGVIFALTTIQHQSVFNATKHGIQQISMRPFGYTYYFKEQELWGYFGIGMSAANMAFEIAFHSKFKKITLIGQDLAYANGSGSHADGHLFGVNDKSIRHDDLEVTAYGGHGTVRTSKIWAMFKNFFETDIASAGDVQVFNATEGGARIEGSIELPFIEVINAHVDQTFQKETIVLEKLDETTIQAHKASIQKSISEMLNFAQTIQKEVETTFENVTKVIEKIEGKKALEVDATLLHPLLDQLDHIKAYFNTEQFVKIFNDSLQAMIIHQEMDLAKLTVRDVHTDEEKVQKMIDWVKAHQYWLFSLAGMVKATVIAMERRGKHGRIISKVHKEGNIFFGHIADTQNTNARLKLQVFIDQKEPIDIELIPFKLRELDAYRFWFELPEDIFDNHIHEIKFVETVNDIVLNEGYFSEPVLMTQRVNGKVSSNDGVIYNGWLKKIDSTSHQKVDVYIDNNLVSSILAEEQHALTNIISKVNSFGFTYILEKNYFDNAQHMISFKTKENYTLENNASHFSHSSKHANTFNNLFYFESLKDFNTMEIIDEYLPNSISFIATTRLLNNTNFLLFLKNISHMFSTIKFVPFYLLKEEKDLIEQKLNDFNIHPLELNYITDIIQNSEIFISDSNDNISIQTSSILRQIAKEIAIVFYDDTNRHISINEIDKTSTPNHPFFTHFSYFGFEQTDLDRYPNSLHQLMFSTLAKQAGMEDYSLDTSMNVETFDLKFIDLILKNKTFKQLMFNLRKKVHEYFAFQS
jgi:hypothetical protein